MRLSVSEKLLSRWPKYRLAGLVQNRLFLSCAFHGVLLFVVLNAWWFGAKSMKPPGSPNGLQTVLDYVPGKLAPQQLAQQHRAKAPRRVQARKLISKETSEPEQAAAPAIEALGDGPATILYVQAFPAKWPQVSANELFIDLVVDVQVDENGRVIQTYTRRGMGSGLDDVVVATVRQWTFHPATKDGRPVPSVQELHFRFDGRHNPSCGWDCFQLVAN